MLPIEYNAPLTAVDSHRNRSDIRNGCQHIVGYHHSDGRVCYTLDRAVQVVQHRAAYFFLFAHAITQSFLNLLYHHVRER